VERPLGEGAFAEVFRVRHRFLGRQAMKVFKQAGMVSAWRRIVSCCWRRICW
jgi:serine/threonine-protein kinase